MSKQVPAGWQIRTIDDVAIKIFGGGTPSRENSDYFVGKIPWITVKDMKEDDFYIHDTLEHITTEAIKNSSTNLVSPGNIIISNRMGLGRGVINKVEIAINQDMKAIILDFNKVTPEFFLYWYKSSKNEIESLGVGSTVKGISLDSLNSLTFAMPPLPEQRKIAAVLSAADRSIAATEKLIAKLADLKQALMQQLLTKGIGHTEFKPSPLGLIPKSWEVKLLSDVISKIIDCEHKTAPFIDNGKYFVVRTNSIKDGQIIFEDAKYTHEEAFREWTQREVPLPGDVLFTREAPAGEAALVPKNLPLCLGQRMVLLKFNQDVNSAFFVYSLYGSGMRKCLNDMLIGTTVSRINMADIKLINCIIPPINEQIKIAGILSTVDRKLSAAKVKLAKAKDLKQGLMNDLLTGKVRIKA